MALRRGQLVKCLYECRNAALIVGFVLTHRHEHADATYPLILLRARRDRPPRRAAEQRDECAPFHAGYDSALIFVSRITLLHFSVSSAMSLPKSAGEPGSTVPPESAIRALILGSVRAELVSWLSLSMTSAGVPLGAPRPNQTLAS